MAIHKQCDLQLTENICKIIDLKVHKNLLNTNYEILEQRKTALKAEWVKMNNINYTVWTLEDEFCNEVWNFYLEHNFYTVFKPCTNSTEIIECRNCEYGTVSDNHAKRIDTIEEDKVTELINEIDNINNQRTLIHNENIEEDIAHATCILNNLKSFSEEILNLIRLVNFLENSQHSCNIITYKKSKTNRSITNTNIRVFKGAEKYSKNRPIATIKENVATFSNNFTKTDTTKKRPRVINNARLGKFTLKKRSVVSLKLGKK